MKHFNNYIDDVHELIQKHKSLGLAREIRLDSIPLNGWYHKANSPFVVLAGDTAVELGNPFQGSANLVLCTSDKHIVNDACITVIGPDISECYSQSLPFGQAILVVGELFTDEDIAEIQRTSNLSNCVYGYMIRQSPVKIWSRVSKEIFHKGFTFAHLGFSLMSHYRERFLIDAIEILFVTSSIVLKDLLSIAEDTHVLITDIHRNLRERNDSLCNELACNSCLNKQDCDTISALIAARARSKL